MQHSVLSYGWQWRVAQQHTDYTEAFLLQQCLLECATVLMYTYIARLIEL
jgi:hypothetical protein